MMIFWKKDRKTTMNYEIFDFKLCHVKDECDFLIIRKHKKYKEMVKQFQPFDIIIEWK